jgi:hypothetical protein
MSNRNILIIAWTWQMGIIEFPSKTDHALKDVAKTNLCLEADVVDPGQAKSKR